VGRDSSSASIAAESSGSNEGLIAFLRDGRLCAYNVTSNKQFGLPVSNPCANPAWSPDGTKLVYVGNCVVNEDAPEYSEGELSVLSLTTGKEAKSLIRLSNDASLCWFSDSDRVAVSGWESARIFSTRGMGIVTDVSETQFQGLTLIGGNAHPVTGELAFLWMDSSKQVYGVAIGTKDMGNWRRLRLGAFIGSGVLPAAPVWHPTNRRLAVPSLAEGQEGILLLSESPGQRPSKDLISDGSFGEWSPNGKLLAYVDRSYKLHVLDESPRKPLSIQGLPNDGVVGTLTWSPDSSSLAVDVAPVEDEYPNFGRADIYAIAIPSGNAVRVISGGSGPAWQPVAVPCATGQFRSEQAVKPVREAPLRHLPTGYRLHKRVDTDFDGDGLIETACAAYKVSPRESVSAPEGAPGPVLWVERDGALIGKHQCLHGNTVADDEAGKALEAVELTGDGNPEILFRSVLWGASDASITLHVYACSKTSLANLVGNAEATFGHSLGGGVAIRPAPKGKAATLLYYDVMWGDNEAHADPHRVWMETYKFRNGRFIKVGRRESRNKGDAALRELGLPTR